ncbi:LuxR family transcriptional regulator [Streptomyces sp. DSM 42041]|uniref:LuxR family transcriptional regulator n=1 Tax=Streptomyces hazeniae TaxID=3075538 RepID=A0ABU2NZC8_9ACTN|nr:LuxR family transcriptional regulator [Streptomyces sp. DSM 42041]MDT0381981.1 LuxR family transcriptional regulator [Streptomyces sp. DSM 42041]
MTDHAADTTQQITQTPQTGPHRPPVGRTALLAALEARVAAGGSAVLTGPSGIGRSTVLEAVAASATARGELVLRASGAETERWLPYAGLADLLGQVPVGLLAALPEPQRSALYGVLLRDRQTTDAGGQGQSVCRLAWRGLLGRCAADRPVLLVVDDAQWLDGPTVDALRYAARRLTGLGVRAVTAGRWPEGMAAGDGGSATWTPTPASVVVPLPPLAPDELAELFAQYGLPARVANTLHADSGGNPYLALALAGAFTDRIPRHWRPAPLPQRVHDMISERLATLPDRARETLLTAAFATRPTVDLLRRAGRAEAEHDIRLAAAAGLLVAEGGTVRFTPPAVGTVLAEHAAAAHRAEVHTALAAVVPDAAGRVRHRALAAPGPDAALVRSLVTAAEAAARQGSHRMAAELYLLAADRTPAEPAGQSARLEWLVAAAEAGASAALPALVHRAADAVLAADASRAQRTRVRIALLDLSGQGLSEMDEVFAAALLDADGDPALMGPLRLRISWSALVDGRPERSGREADAAAGHARAAGDTTTEAMALGVRATVSVITGRDDHRAVLDRALRLPEPPLNGWLHASPRFVAARFAVFEDRLAEAREELLRMLALVERGSGEEVVHVLRSLAEVSVRTGRCRDALDFADRAVRITEEASLSPGPAWWDAAVAELAGGSVGRAVAYAESGLRASTQERDAIYRGRHLHVLGQARMRGGDVRGGVETLLRIETLERGQGVCSPLALRWHGDLASGLAALGETDRAEEVIRAARAAVGSRARGVGVTAQLDRAEAAVRAARGDADTALELLGDAARRFEELGQPLERGHCLLERARVDRRRRRHAAARAAVAEALELFTECGARPWAEQAGRSLDRLGAGTSPARQGTGAHEDRDPAPRRVLTDNEARIAALVGEGATNQEVAARMFLSVKTIEASLTRIYRKLGIRSRTQLGTWLRSGAGRADAGVTSSE